MSDIWDALASEGDPSPIFRFTNEGDSITGVVVEKPRTFPVNEYKSTEPKIGPDGKPVMQILLALATEQCADENHDGRWRVYVDKPLLKAAFAKALRAAGVKDVPVGAKVTITFIGYRETRGGGSAKDFTVSYVPPAADPDGPVGSGELGEFIDGDTWGDGAVA